MVKKDCFAYYVLRGKCCALTDTYCDREKCAFYRTDLKRDLIESDIRRYKCKK